MSIVLDHGLGKTMGSKKGTPILSYTEDLVCWFDSTKALKGVEMDCWVSCRESPWHEGSTLALLTAPCVGEAGGGKVQGRDILLNGDSLLLRAHTRPWEGQSNLEQFQGCFMYLMHACH